VLRLLVSGCRFGCRRRFGSRRRLYSWLRCRSRLGCRRRFGSRYRRRFGSWYWFGSWSRWRVDDWWRHRRHARWRLHHVRRTVGAQPTAHCLGIGCKPLDVALDRFDRLLHCSLTASRWMRSKEVGNVLQVQLVRERCRDGTDQVCEAIATATLIESIHNLMAHAHTHTHRERERPHTES
jgi:hypothetical protein